MTTATDIADRVEANADEVFPRRWGKLRDEIVELLEDFGADTGPKKLATIQELLAGSDATAAAAALPWAIDVVRAEMIQRIAARYLDDPAEFVQ